MLFLVKSKPEIKARILELSISTAGTETVGVTLFWNGKPVSEAISYLNSEWYAVKLYSLIFSFAASFQR